MCVPHINSANNDIISIFNNFFLANFNLFFFSRYRKTIQGEIKIQAENGETRVLRSAPDWTVSFIGAQLDDMIYIRSVSFIHCT